MERKSAASSRRGAVPKRPAHRSAQKKTRPVKRTAAASPRKPASTMVRSRKRRSRPQGAYAIVIGSLALAVVLVLALGVLAVMMPEIRLNRAHAMVASGDLDAADHFINVLESEGTPENRISMLRLELAEQHLQAGHYEDALSLAADLPESDRQTEVILASRYGQADELYAAGQYEDAGQRFYQLTDYRDSAQRYVDCRCALAVLTYLSGDEDTALKRLLAIDGAPDRIEGVVRHLVEDDARSWEMLAMDMFNAQGLARMKKERARISAAREHIVAGRLAAGYRHSVGLQPNGRVLAAGNNNFGQCDVSEWQDVIQVAAGAMHTLGLRTDGTVYATGNNSFGQCDVSGWTDIVCVAASAYGSIGLKKDGTVVASSSFESDVSGWHGVTIVAGGSYSAGCLYEPDGMLCTHPGGQMKSAEGLTSLCVCGPVSAGIDENGSLVTNYPKPPKWKDLACLSLSESGLVGVTKGGKAISYMFRGRRETEFEIEGNAVEAAASGTHILVMNEAGHVFAFGLNDQGQCDVSDWRL